MDQTNSVADLYEAASRPTDQVYWKHKTKPVWIVFYPAVQGVRQAFYEAYKAIQPVPKGREPYSVDNRRISNGHGYPTLEEAMEAAQ